MQVHREIAAWIKLRQYLVLMLFGFMLTACSQSPDPQRGVISGNKLSAPLPNAIAALALDETNLIVDVVVDGGTILRVEDLVVDTVNKTFTGKIPSIGEGSHTLSLIFSVIDPTYGTVEVVTTSSITVNVIANQDTPADFSSATLTPTDTDGDTISNLVELGEGSNPTEPSYYVGGTVSGLLGSGAILQLNGDSDLSLTTDDGYKFVPALADNSTYTVTVATQPSSPSQTCTASNAGGTVSGATVENITVMCITDDTTAPTVSSTSPIAAAVDVARSSTVTATFDEDIFSTTVDSSSFTLSQANGGSVSGAVTFDGAVNIATFTPASKLAIRTSCIATLTTAITDLSGNALASNYTWSFTTADGAWVDAGLIETDNAGDAYPPRVAFDGSGNAIAVWFQHDGTRTNIWANRYVAGKGWDGSARLIETDNTGNAHSPQVVFDSSGNAIAVWSQYDGTRFNIWANRYVAGKGWGSAGLIETDNTGGAHVPQVAFDGGGNAIAVWSQYDGTTPTSNIWANRFVAGKGWGSAGLIETDNTGYAYAPQVAFDGGGNAIAVWSQYDGTPTSNIWANRFVAGKGWGSAGLIETDNTGNARPPQIAFDGGGNAIAVWEQYDGTRFSIWANRFVAGKGWGSAGLIETDNMGGASYPQVAVDGSGNAIAVWRQYDGTRTNIWANRYVAGKGWGSAGLIETANTGDAHLPQVAVDGSGNAIAVWEQHDGTRDNIWTNRYVADKGWGSARLIETDNTGYARSPQVAFDGSGNAIAVWRQNDGIRTNIWANRFE